MSELLNRINKGSERGKVFLLLSCCEESHQAKQSPNRLLEVNTQRLRPSQARETLDAYAVLDLIEYQRVLYAATSTVIGYSEGVGRVYRYDDVRNQWTLVGDNTDHSVNDSVNDLEV